LEFWRFKFDLPKPQKNTLRRKKHFQPIPGHRGAARVPQQSNEDAPLVAARIDRCLAPPPTRDRNSGYLQTASTFTRVLQLLLPSRQKRHLHAVRVEQTRAPAIEISTWLQRRAFCTNGSRHCIHKKKEI
jgi:hypothetical protein